jgi:hypothetical protein
MGSPLCQVTNPVALADQDDAREDDETSEQLGCAWRLTEPHERDQHCDDRHEIEQ